MKKTSIGGSALIEGLMMIGPENAAIAIRKSTGEVILERKGLPIKSKLTKVPILRSVISFFSQMVLSTKALMFSAEFIEDGDSSIDLESGNNIKRCKETFFEKLINKLFGESSKNALVYFSLIMSLAFSIGLFILLPNVMAGFLKFDKSTFLGVIYYNLFEGVIKISIFLGYLFFASQAKDIKRVWQYHGAEHKTINCYENGDELTVENVMKYSTKNPRCGTSYMFLVMIISTFLFSFAGWYEIWINVLIRLFCIPVVAGITFEIFRFLSKSNSSISKALSMPGMLFQLLTTKEPDKDQVEVAIIAFNGVSTGEFA